MNERLWGKIRKIKKKEVLNRTATKIGTGSSETLAT
jgi:hypothetical protein